MIAAVVPPTRDLAAEADADAVRREVDAYCAAIRAERKRMIKWMVVIFVPAWVSVWASFVAVLLKF